MPIVTCFAPCAIWVLNGGAITRRSNTNHVVRRAAFERPPNEHARRALQVVTRHYVRNRLVIDEIRESIGTHHKRVADFQFDDVKVRRYGVLVPTARVMRFLSECVRASSSEI